MKNQKPISAVIHDGERVQTKQFKNNKELDRYMGKRPAQQFVSTNLVTGEMRAS